MTLTHMTTAPVSSTIAAIGSDTITAGAHAADHTTAWTAALRAARAALLTGDLDTLAVTPSATTTAVPCTAWPATNTGVSTRRR